MSTGLSDFRLCYSLGGKGAGVFSGGESRLVVHRLILLPLCLKGLLAFWLFLQARFVLPIDRSIRCHPR
jgi:hypothetical protein